MLRKHLYALAPAVLMCAVTVVAQSAPPANPPSTGRPMRRGPSCLQQAGVDSSVMEQLRSIQRDMHTQVESVCSNTSLTPQQRNEQAHEIRQQAHQKIESLITPDQQKSLMACREERMGNHAGAGGSGEPGGGCGEMQPNGTRPTNGTPGARNENNRPPAAN